MDAITIRKMRDIIWAAYLELRLHASDERRKRLDMATDAWYEATNGQ